MSEACGTCAAHLAQIAYLNQVINDLTMRLMMLHGVLTSINQFIATEMEPGQATMSRRDALLRVHQQITLVLEEGL